MQFYAIGVKKNFKKQIYLQFMLRFHGASDHIFTLFILLSKYTKQKKYIYTFVDFQKAAYD